MKRKTILSVVSLLLGATLFTACTNSNQKVTFSNYWNKNMNTPVTASQTAETLVYNVGFEADAGLNDSYTVQYTNGAYKTTLKTETLEEKTLYRYETELSITVTYQFGSETAEFTDSTKTSVLLETANGALRPISSHKELLNHSPSNVEATKMEDCYEEYKYTVDVTYDDDLDDGDAIVKNLNNPDADYTQEFEIDDDKYNYLDNEELLLALRAINPTYNSSANFLVYAPFSKAVQNVKASFDTAVAGDFEFAKDGAAKQKYEISYYPVTLSIDSQNPGSSHTVWVAKTTDPLSNDYRNVILRMEVPVSYNLGTLIYTLDTATFAN